jgi:hypothetical protein
MKECLRGIGRWVDGRCESCQGVWPFHKMRCLRATVFGYWDELRNRKGR